MIGAIRLPDRSLSQQKTRPARNVTATEPDTSSTCPPVRAAAAANSRLSDIVCRVGAMCQRPNSAEVIRLPRHGPHNLSADPSRTPRKANSSGIAVSSTIDTPSLYSSRPPSICARESWRNPFVAGITAATTSTSKTTPKAPAPYSRPARISVRARPRSARVAPAPQAIRISAAVRRLTDIAAGPRSPDERATANTASTATASPKQRPAFMGSPKGPSWGSPKGTVSHPERVEGRLQGSQAGIEGPALLCAGGTGGDLGVQRVTDGLQRGERIIHLGTTALSDRFLAQDVQRLGEVMRAVLDVMPGSAIRVEERTLTLPLAHGTIESPALLVGVLGPRPPEHRLIGATGRAGGQHDDEHEDQGAENDPQPDEVEAESAGRRRGTARRCGRRRGARRYRRAGRARCRRRRGGCRRWWGGDRGRFARGGRGAGGGHRAAGVLHTPGGQASGNQDGGREQHASHEAPHAGPSTCLILAESADQRYTPRCQTRARWAAAPPRGARWPPWVGCDAGSSGYCAAASPPCRASWRSFSSCLDREVFRTVPPYLLIASTALSGVTFSSIRNRAELPGWIMSRTWSWNWRSMLVLASLPMRAPIPAPMAMPKTGMKNSRPNRNPQNRPQVAPAPTA